MAAAASPAMAECCAPGARTSRRTLRRRHAHSGRSRSRAGCGCRSRWRCIYLGVPFLVERAVHGYHMPVFIALLPVLAIILVLLLVDPTFSLSRELSRGFSLLTFVSILAVFAIGGGAVAYWVARASPRLVPRIPAQPPRHLLTIMLLYPLMSVPLQELVYRTFFFHRYGAAVCARVVAGHPDQRRAVRLRPHRHRHAACRVGTMATGVLFALRYAMTRSFWAVYLEHTLWGALVFTVGLGRFFFTGVGIVGAGADARPPCAGRSSRAEHRVQW